MGDRARSRGRPDDGAIFRGGRVLQSGRLSACPGSSGSILSRLRRWPEAAATASAQHCCQPFPRLRAATNVARSPMVATCYLWALERCCSELTIAPDQGRGWSQWGYHAITSRCRLRMATWGVQRRPRTPACPTAMAVHSAENWTPNAAETGVSADVLYSTTLRRPGLHITPTIGITPGITALTAGPCRRLSQKWASAI